MVWEELHLAFLVVARAANVVSLERRVDERKPDTSVEKRKISDLNLTKDCFDAVLVKV